MVLKAKLNASKIQKLDINESIPNYVENITAKRLRNKKNRWRLIIK